MGIFDPSSGNSPDRPINLVGRYQGAMNRVAYSPSVAQAAARSGVNPTMATRIAAREVAQQSAAALPGLMSQEEQMMETRRLENERKEREGAALALNVGGQVLGTALNAYAPGAGTVVQGAAAQGADAYMNNQSSINAYKPPVANGAGSAMGGAMGAQVVQQPVPVVAQAAPVALTQYAPQQAIANSPINLPAPAPAAPQVDMVQMAGATGPYDEAINPGANYGVYQSMQNNQRSQAGTRRRQRSR